MPGDSLETRQNVRMTAGDAKTIRVTVPEDLSGQTIRWALVDGRGGASLVSKSTGGNGVVITATAADESTFEVTLDPSDTRDLLGEYWHEAEHEDASGDPTTSLTGAFIVRPDSV